ncbi:MAG: LytR/AlgR family response regulator transcription factor, partial [Ilyomonas sp.]
MKITIIEDEKHAVDNLMNVLKELEEKVEVAAIISSVKQGVEYFSKPHNSDLIFCDVQLPDGVSFEIFNKAAIETPVIFITAYNAFVLNAFEYNGIDYLLKPVTKNELDKAFQKYKLLEQHFSSTNKALSNLLEYINVKKKTRLIVRKGIESISIKLEDIVLFFTENKVAYVVDKTRKKYIAYKNLSELEQELYPSKFFRTNRKYIINID